MSCTTNLLFTYSYSNVNSTIRRVLLDVPEIYDSTVIQIQIKDLDDKIIQAWHDHITLASLQSDFLIDLTAYSDLSGVKVEIRLARCPEDTDPPPAVGDSPDPEDLVICEVSDIPDDDCDLLIPSSGITNPYINPAHQFISSPLNDISIPKTFKINIVQTDCAQTDISAQICSIRCPPPLVNLTGCRASFFPSESIYSYEPLSDLQQVLIAQKKYTKGVPFDLDFDYCKWIDGSAENKNFRGKPDFGIGYDDQYILIKPLYRARKDVYPFIDLLGYRTSVGTWCEFPTFTNSADLREWFRNHFRFFSVGKEFDRDGNVIDKIARIWPYTDFAWYAGDRIESLSANFVPEPDVVYVEVIPC
jgi:hypothetical protein